MWLNFWANNIQFALNFFGAIIFFALAWLAFDAYSVKKEIKSLSRVLGFFLLAVWFTIHSLNITTGFFFILSVVSYIAGSSFVLFNIFAEKPPPRPKFEAVLILPAAATVLFWAHFTNVILLFFIAFTAFKRYQSENQKTLKSFFTGFIFLALASFVATLNAKTASLGFGWLIERVFQALGFSFLGYWGWQYLKLRIKESLLLVFVGMALFVAVVVTFTFSAILFKNMENNAEASLVSNVKVLDFTFSRMESEVLSNAQFFSREKIIENALINKDFILLEERTRQLMSEKSMNILTVADEEGNVILRAHSLTIKGDNIKEEKAGGEALNGNPHVTIESTRAEGFSIRGGAPVYDSKNNIVGVVITGYIVDNAFADYIKKTTGLEATIYKQDTVQATSIFDSGAKTRNVGAKQTDLQVVKQVLENGLGLTGGTTIFSKPYLAAYLPLKNAENQIIGMLQASRPQAEIVEAATATNRLTLLVTIIIVIMMLMPAYWLAKKLTEEI